MKMGDDTISGGSRVELERELDNYHLILIKISEQYSESLDTYSNLMRESINNVNPYFDETGLIRTHLDAKNRAIAKVEPLK